MLSRLSSSSFSSAVRRTPFLNSLNSIVFQTTPLPFKLQPPLWTKNGFLERMQRIKRFFATGFNLIRLKAKSPEDTKTKLINECSLLYTDFLKACLTGDTASLKSITSDNLYLSLKPRVSKATGKPHLAPINMEAKIVDAAYCQVQILEAVDFVQLLVRFENECNDPEYIVFEKCLSVSRPTWKIVGRMNESTDLHT